MIHEKIIKRENGTQYRIDVNVYFSSYQGGLVYDVELHTRAKGKKKWENTPNGIDDYKMRQLSMSDRRAARIATFTSYVCIDEINQAKIEAWEKMKPIIN
jgi:hypothetical protein